MVARRREESREALYSRRSILSAAKTDAAVETRGASRWRKWEWVLDRTFGRVLREILHACVSADAVVGRKRRARTLVATMALVLAQDAMAKKNW